MLERPAILMPSRYLRQIYRGQPYLLWIARTNLKNMLGMLRTPISPLNANKVLEGLARASKAYQDF